MCGGYLALLLDWDVKPKEKWVNLGSYFDKNKDKINISQLDIWANVILSAFVCFTLITWKTEIHFLMQVMYICFYKNEG